MWPLLMYCPVAGQVVPETNLGADLRAIRRAKVRAVPRARVRAIPRAKVRAVEQ